MHTKYYKGNHIAIRISLKKKKVTKEKAIPIEKINEGESISLCKVILRLRKAK